MPAPGRRFPDDSTAFCEAARASARKVLEQIQIVARDEHRSRRLRLKRRKMFMTSIERSGSDFRVGSSAIRIGETRLATTARAMPTALLLAGRQLDGTLCSRARAANLIERGARALADFLRTDARDDRAAARRCRRSCDRAAACDPGTRRRRCVDGGRYLPARRRRRRSWPFTCELSARGRSMSAISLSRLDLPAPE